MHWTTAKKVRLVEIDTEERERGLGFMKRVGDRWEQEFGERLKDQKLRDNAARFKKEKQIANFVLVRKRNEESEEEGTEAGVEDGELEETARVVGVSEKDVEQEPHRRTEADEAAGTEGEKALREVFTAELAQLTPTNATNIEERNRLSKLPPEIAKYANKVLSKYLKRSNKLVEITDAVYVMGKAIARSLNAKMRVPGIGRRLNREGNRRERGLRHQIKALRQRIARGENELYRRKTQRIATKKEVRILQESRKYVDGGSTDTQELVEASEKWLDELRGKKVILLKAVEKRKPRKNNAIIVTD